MAVFSFAQAVQGGHARPLLVPVQWLNKDVKEVLQVKPIMSTDANNVLTARNGGMATAADRTAVSVKRGIIVLNRSYSAA